VDEGGGRAWTNKELRALEDGLVWLGPGRAAELRAQVPGPAMECSAPQPRCLLMRRLLCTRW